MSNRQEEGALAGPLNYRWCSRWPHWHLPCFQVCSPSRRTLGMVTITENWCILSKCRVSRICLAEEIKKAIAKWENNCIFFCNRHAFRRGRTTNLTREMIFQKSDFSLNCSDYDFKSESDMDSKNWRSILLGWLCLLDITNSIAVLLTRKWHKTWS